VVYCDEISGGQHCDIIHDIVLHDNKQRNNMMESLREEIIKDFENEAKRKEKVL